MAGFPLGGGSHHHQHHRHHQHQSRDSRDQENPIQPESLFLYGGRSSGGGGGFQIWQQQHQQQQQQQQQQHQLFSGSGILSFADEAAAGGSMRGGGAGGISCQDCGNQAKKDCAHLRCRTCCKSRGFHCPTHVKSTWVPAARRRERQQLASLSGGGGGGGESSKRPREVRSLTTPITSSSGRFPSEVNSEAVFRCVRLGPVDEGESEYAYQASVSIAGHVFKGILHDHGPESSPADYQTAAAAAASTGALTSGGGEIGGDIVMTSASAAALMDPYSTPICDFMAGAGAHFYSHHPRP